MRAIASFLLLASLVIPVSTPDIQEAKDEEHLNFVLTKEKPMVAHDVSSDAKTFVCHIVNRENVGKTVVLSAQCDAAVVFNDDNTITTEAFAANYTVSLGAGGERTIIIKRGPPAKNHIDRIVAMPRN